MLRGIRGVAVALLIAPLATACATKGYVRDQIATLRAQQDSALVAERRERMAADSTLRVDIATLRRDLDGLRTEFGAKITALEEGVQFAFPVNFAFDDASVREQDRAALERFAQVAGRHYPGSLITVEGFADPAGPRQYNLALSRRRAENVRRYIVEQGLAEQQVRAVGYGENRQVVPGAARYAEGAEQNRRVVFVIESRGAGSDLIAVQPRTN